jgi:formate hydrogenlyase subunit 3/multisubunit Na+/H+ antiporter MnhD subunit
MPAASVLAPPALLAAAAALGWALELAGARSTRLPAAVAAWLALGVLLAGWAATGRGTLELNLPGTLAGAPLALRMDAISVAFGLVVLLPTAMLLTFQRRSAGEASLASLAASASLLATAAGSVLLTAVALGGCASVVLLALRQEEDRLTGVYWVSLSAAALLLLWAGAVLEVTGGTSVYSAAPITSLRTPVFLLLAGAGLLCSGLLPWPSWLPAMWERQRLEAGTLALALLAPLGFLLLSRAYVLGAGRWPSPALNSAVAAVGAATALAAALRAQAAQTRSAFFGEMVPLGGGMALLALALGTPFGISAAILTLAGSAVVIGILPLLPSLRWPPAALGVAVAVGVPPSVVFGGRLLAIQAGVEAGGPSGFLALLGAASWLVALASSARLPRLLEADEGERGQGRAGVYLGLALGLGGGVGIGVLETLLALPVAAEAIGSPASAVTGGYTAVVTASGGWAAVTLGAPLLLLAAGAALVSRSVWARWPARPVALKPPPPPFLALPTSRLGARLTGAGRGLRLPEQYRSLVNPAALEAAAATGRPWLWGAITMALIIAVTR